MIFKTNVPQKVGTKWWKHSKALWIKDLDLKIFCEQTKKTQAVETLGVGSVLIGPVTALPSQHHLGAPSILEIIKEVGPFWECPIGCSLNIRDFEEEQVFIETCSFLAPFVDYFVFVATPLEETVLKLQLVRPLWERWVSAFFGYNKEKWKHDCFLGFSEILSLKEINFFLKYAQENQFQGVFIQEEKKQNQQEEYQEVMKNFFLNQVSFSLWKPKEKKGFLEKKLTKINWP